MQIRRHREGVEELLDIIEANSMEFILLQRCEESWELVWSGATEVKNTVFAEFPRLTSELSTLR